jgi:adenylate cyclase
MTDVPVEAPSTFGKYFQYLRIRDNEPTDDNIFLHNALTRHKAEGLLLAVRARWAALAVIAVLLPFINFSIDVLYYECLVLGFVVIGWAQLRVGRVGRSGVELLLILADIALMTFIFVVPNPFVGDEWPTAMQYKIGNFHYFFVLLASATMAYSWRTIVSYGTWVAALWLIAATIIFFFGHQVPEFSVAISQAVGNDESISRLLDPNRVDFGDRFQEVVVFCIVAFTLALNGWRTNKLLVAQADVARERSNLARYFAPSIVEQLANQDISLGEERSQDVALLFADIVGFTRLAERSTPAQTMAILREFHRRMEQAIFKNDGTLNKFLGDGVMATFGTPEPGPHDARNALSSAMTMIDLMDEWNTERGRRGETPIILSIGLHYGQVTLGNIGSERILEFAVIGDTVNVASRLEALTREHDTNLIVSEDLVQAIQTRGDQIPPGLENISEQSLRGRDGPVTFRILNEAT